MKPMLQGIYAEQLGEKDWKINNLGFNFNSVLHNVINF